MLQLAVLEKILKACHDHGLHTAVDTAGHVPYADFERILPYVDLLLYDVKSMNAETHTRYTGVSNRRILDNLRRLLSTDVPLWVRIPIIPTVNDTEEEMVAIRDFLAVHGAPERIELLPYHALGEQKYEALDRSAPAFVAPSEDVMTRLRRVFS